MQSAGARTKRACQPVQGLQYDRKRGQTADRQVGQSYHASNERIFDGPHGKLGKHRHMSFVPDALEKASSEILSSMLDSAKVWKVFVDRIKQVFVCATLAYVIAKALIFMRGLWYQQHRFCHLSEEGGQ